MTRDGEQMNSPLAQIVAVRANGTDPRTVVEMGPLADREAALAKLRKDGKWPGHELRPHLQLWAASGRCLDPAAKTKPLTKSEQ